MRAAGGSSTSSTSPATPTWTIPPSGCAIITRVLESHGYKVGFIAQPDWNDPESIAVFGRAAAGIPRVGGQHGLHGEPLHGDTRSAATTTPTRRAAQGGCAPQPRGRGVFATSFAAPSRKRPSFWAASRPACAGSPTTTTGRIPSKRSILLDSGADLISYGMGERSIVEIADALAAGLSVSDLTFIDGTVYRTRSLEHVVDYVDVAQLGRGFGRQARLRGELRHPVPRERPGRVAVAWWRPIPMACMSCRTRRLRR